MSSWHPEDEISISDSEDEDDGLKKAFHGRDAIVFVVDAFLYHEPDFLMAAFSLIREAFLSGLLVNDKDLMALILTNTKNYPEPNEANCLDAIVMPENCAVFLPPRQLNTAIVKHYLEFLETVSEDFEEVYGVCENDGANFSHVLRLCLDLVDQCTYSVDNTTIVYLTDKDTPHPVNSEAYGHALQKASDLSGKEVEFQIIPMWDEFNYDVFYKEFICLVHNIELDSFEPIDPQRSREMLADRKFKQNFVRRSLGHFKLTLGPDLALSAQYFNFYQKAKGPRKVLIRRADNAVIQRKRLTKVFKKDPETEELTDGRLINITDAWYEINLGNTPIRLSYEQVNRVRNLHQPGMMLLGFQPRSCLDNFSYSKTCNFMYPDDSHIVGSKRLFRALWERCKARDKIAICLFMSKRKSMPRYVALVPESREDADSGSHYSLITNDGFKIVYIPCASYVRELDLSEWNSIENSASGEQVDICSKIVKKFRLGYDPTMFCDPELDQLQTKLLGLAFNVTNESTGSRYFPDAEMQDKRIESILPKFQELFGEDEEPAKKRSAAASKADGSNAAKIPKLSADNLNNKDYVLDMANKKALDSCTKDQLLQILEQHYNRKVAKSTKKQDLLDIIYNN